MQLPSSRPAVLVSLPRNDVALALAAQRAGADGLKVHINVQHRASGTTFGALADERDQLAQILAVGLPTGLVAGGSCAVSTSDMVAAQEMGFDYFDVYAADAPATYVEACGEVTPMVALGPGDGAEQARALVSRGVQALELSTLEPERYGTPLSLATLARLETVTDGVDVPVVVPTQHRIQPADVRLLHEAGAAAVLLGAVVTGDDAADLAKRITAFVEAAHG
jgi:hypothetical protein